jgi:adenosylcobinamide-GDP ribazoletransferase
VPEAPAADSPLTAGPPAAGRSVGSIAVLLGGLRAAGMLLTRLPLGRGPVPAASLPLAAGFIPLVGLALGVLGALLLRLLEPPLGARLAAALTIAVLLLATGALHEDGLADTADALGGARDREQLFAILKDSRLGTYGVLALLLSMIVRLESLTALGGQAPAAYLVAAVVSRAPLVGLMAALAYVTPSSAARNADVVRVGRGTVLGAAVTTLVVAAAAVGLQAFAWWAVGLALLAAAGAALLAGWNFRRRAGGITGDFLGAAQQVCELAVLLTLLLAV